MSWLTPPGPQPVAREENLQLHGQIVSTILP